MRTNTGLYRNTVTIVDKAASGPNCISALFGALIAFVLYLAKPARARHLQGMIDTEIEPQLRRSLGIERIAGVDEVGRGPWAGPVTACAVVLDPLNIPNGLNDSKKLTAKRREVLYAQIMEQADVSVAHVSVEEIDRINILQASLLAMRRAMEGLAHPADYALIDGNKTPVGLACPSDTLIKGDGRCLSIAAASIVAKVTRDRMMVALSQQFPGYGWETNAGYGTKAHIAGLETLGVTQHHRRSFKPIHNMLCSEGCPKNV